MLNQVTQFFDVQHRVLHSAFCFPTTILARRRSTCPHIKAASCLHTRVVSVRRCQISRTERDLIVIETDTSCILAWLLEQGYEVIAFMADVGQEEVCVFVRATIRH